MELRATIELPDCEKKFENRPMLSLRTQCRSVIYGQTDGQTDILPMHNPRLCKTLRNKNDRQVGIG